MDREETRRVAEVMLAFADGANVERIRRTLPDSPYPFPGCKWQRISIDAPWDWQNYIFRIAPDPPPFRVDGPGLYIQSDGERGWVREVVPLDILYPVRGVDAKGIERQWRMDGRGRGGDVDLIAKAS